MKIHVKHTVFFTYQIKLLKIVYWHTAVICKGIVIFGLKIVIILIYNSKKLSKNRNLKWQYVEKWIKKAVAKSWFAVLTDNQTTLK